MKFKELSKEEKLALCEAVIDGKCVEIKFSEDGVWNTRHSKVLELYDTFEYRIAPEKPSINWDHVAPEFKYLCVNKLGDGFLSNQPYRNIANGYFEWGDWPTTTIIRADAFASFKPGNCAPEDSLVERPE